jgi:hypothetical protein
VRRFSPNELQDAEIANINDEISRFQRNRTSAAPSRYLSSNESLLQDPLARCDAQNLQSFRRLTYFFVTV